MRFETKKHFACLCSVAAVMVLGNSMIVPLLPVIRRSLNIDLVQAGLLITAFSVSAGLTIPIAGFLSDRYGRKMVIVPALVVYGVFGVITGVLPLFLKQAALIPMLVSRAIQGIGAGGTYPIAMALAGDIFHTKERRAALGYLEASNGGGKVAAPIIGSALGMLHWTAPFYMYGAAALPVALAVWLDVPEPEMKQKPKSIGEYFTMCKKVVEKKLASVAVCFLAGGIVLFLYFGVLSVLSDVLEAERGITGIFLGLVIAIPVAAMALTAFLGGRWFTHEEAVILKWAAAGGMGVAALGLLGTFLIRNPVLQLGSILVMSIGNGLVLPSLNSLITGSAPGEERGLVTSLYGTARHIGAASGPPLFGFVFNRWNNVVFLVAAGIALVTCVLVSLVVREKAMLGDPETGGREAEKEMKGRPEHHRAQVEIA